MRGLSLDGSHSPGYLPVLPRKIRPRDGVSQPEHAACPRLQLQVKSPLKPTETTPAVGHLPPCPSDCGPRYALTILSKPCAKRSIRSCGSGSSLTSRNSVQTGGMTLLSSSTVISRRASCSVSAVARSSRLTRMGIMRLPLPLLEVALQDAQPALHLTHLKALQRHLDEVGQRPGAGDGRLEG